MGKAYPLYTFTLGISNTWFHPVLNVENLHNQFDKIIYANCHTN